jgi:hypothetical protein
LAFILSCNKSNDTKRVSLLHQQVEKNFKNAHLTKDDVLILNINYPKILKKIEVREPLTPKDIIILFQIGVSSGNIIHIIKYTQTNFILTTDDVVDLQLGGVPFEVINFMIDS